MKPTQERLVIVGNGMAAGKLIEETLAIDRARYEITVVGDEPYGNYNRIKLLYKLLRDDVEEFFLNTVEWYAQNGVRTVLGSPVTSIDRAAKSVTVASGDRIAYDKLVLAVGSKPFIPPMSGLDLKGIGWLRSLADVDRIKVELEGKSEVLVVGGGLLGLELALILKAMGKRVTVSHLMKSLMETQLSEEAASYLQKKLEAKNLRFVMGTYITDLLGTTAGVQGAVFKDGRQIETEMVLFSTGIRPNVDLAKLSGLATNKGILVDENLKTSDDSIFAVGECIEFGGKVWGLVAPVYEQARTLASCLTGTQKNYVPAELPPTRLKSDIPVISMGLLNPREGDEVALYQDQKSMVYKRLILKDDKIVGANLIGEDLNADAIALHFSAQIPAPERRADLLFPGAKTAEVMDASNWADDLLVCDCAGITAGKLRASIHKGNDTLTKIMNATKAGTGCGSCKNKIKAVLVASLGELKEDPTDRYYVPGIPLDRDALSAHILQNELKSVSRVLKSIPDSADDPKTRMGLDYLLNFLWKGDYTVENDSRSANDRYSGNIQKDGSFSVIPHMSGGMVAPKELRALADVAEEYGAQLKVTGADRIGLYSIQKKDLQEVWKKLEMGSGHAYTKSFRACKACVGSQYCRFGLADSLELGARMSDRYRGTVGPAKLKMGVSGCPRNCSEATIKDFGVVAVEGAFDVYVGGNAGGKVVAAQKIARVKTEDEVIKIADRFYEFYRRHGKFGERTAHFVERIGLEAVMDGILFDTKENLDQLEKDFAAMRRNYSDPWKNPELLDNEHHAEYDAQKAYAKDAQKRSGKSLPKPDSGGILTLCKQSDVSEGQSLLVPTEAGDFAVFHGRDGTWVVTESRCPHQGGPMVDSIYSKGKLTCPLHNFTFDIKTGGCGNAEVPNLRVWNVQLDDQNVSVLLGSSR